MKEKKDINVKIGVRIKMSREAAGYTQDKFAEMIQMGSKNLSDIERGIVGVSLSTIKRICIALKISSDLLIMDELEAQDSDKVSFLIERLKQLSPKQLDLAVDINNKLFEVMELHEEPPEK